MSAPTLIHDKIHKIGRQKNFLLDKEHLQKDLQLISL